MANVTFSRKELTKHFPLNEKNLEKISLLGTPLEKENSQEIEIEVFPNRPDLLSTQGFIRAFKQFIGKSPGLKKYKVTKSGKKLIVEKTLPKEWPYAISCIIKNLKLDDQKIKDIINVQEKLGTTMLRKRKKGGIGIYPLNKIEFPIKFKGLEPNQIKFQPLKSTRELTGKQILLKHPTGKEYADICKKWDKFPIFTDNKNKIMSMPPIINSQEIGKINKDSKEIFIEVTGVDLRILTKAMNILVTTLADMGGKIYSMDCIQQNKKKIRVPNLSPEKIKLSLENTNKLLGLNLKESDLQKLLPKMGYDYKSGTVKIPAWRVDILHEVDIIEDIAIAYGYNNFTPEIPNITTSGSESKKSKTRRKLSEILIGLQALETSTYHLIKTNEAKKIKNPIKVKDSKTEYKILRPNLLIPNLRILSENSDVEYPHKIFEIGSVFSKNSEKETGIEEKDNLFFAKTPGNFTEIKQSIDYLMDNLGIKFDIGETQIPESIEGRTGSILVNGKSIGFFGEIHPTTLRKWGMKMPLAVFEISLEEIYKIFN